MVNYSATYTIKQPNYGVGDMILQGAFGALTGCGGYGVGVYGGFGGFNTGCFGPSLWNTAGTMYSGYGCMTGTSGRQVKQFVGVAVGSTLAQIGFNALDNWIGGGKTTKSSITTSTTTQAQWEAKAEQIVDREQPHLKNDIKKAKDDLEEFYTLTSDINKLKETKKNLEINSKNENDQAKAIINKRIEEIETQISEKKAKIAGYKDETTLKEKVQQAEEARATAIEKTATKLKTQAEGEVEKTQQTQ